MTGIELLAAGGWALALVTGAVREAERRAHERNVRFMVDERLNDNHKHIEEMAHLNNLVVKMAARESKPEAIAKAFGEQVNRITESFNATLATLMVGREGGKGTVVDTPDELRYDNLPNTFNVEDTRQWMPTHELVDSNMWPDDLSPLKDIPKDGPGGWVG